MFGRVIKVGLILLFSVNVFAGKIDKAYEALSVYDYFKAKSLFEELLEKEPTACTYGLSLIYYRNDNPFHNLDSAYTYVLLVEDNYSEIGRRKKEELLKFSIDSTHISDLKNNIVSAFWDGVKGSNSVPQLTSFIKRFPDFHDISNVMLMRNDLAFAIADSINTFQSFREFYTSYPNDPRAAKAKSAYEQMLFDEKTESKTLQSYIDFVLIYPDNSHVKEANDNIYLLSTEKQTAKSFKWFIDNFPNNPNVPEAWEKLFVLSFTDFNDREIHNFIQNNHDFPFPEMLSEARVLRDLELFQVSKRGKWGFINSKGEMKIHPNYEFENDFSNEIALVANEEFIGYINKNDNQIIDFIYDDGSDFIEGVAHVVKGDSIALIDKLGRKILGFEYSYISDAVDGVILAKRKSDGKYIYFDTKGQRIFGDKEFFYAGVFSNGTAIVGDSLYFGAINSKGVEVIDKVYLSIISDEENRFRVKNKNSRFGLITLPEQDTIIPFWYDYIGELSDGIYAVFTKDKYGYKKSDGSNLTEIKFIRFKDDVIKTKFKGGFALTLKRNKYGAIDSLGKKVFPNIFDAIGDVVDFPVPCSKRGKWGYVTKKVSLWSPYEYDYAGAFIDGVAIVSKKGKYGVINKKKKNVISFKYDKLSIFKDDYYLAKENSFYGILAKDGSVIIPFYYSKIEVYDGSLLRLSLFGEYHYYNIKSNVFMYGMLPKKENVVDSVKVN